jgi:hypothetical protein
MTQIFKNIVTKNNPSEALVGAPRNNGNMLMTVVCGNSIAHACKYDGSVTGWNYRSEVQWANALHPVMQFPTITPGANCDVNGIQGFSGQQIDAIMSDYVTSLMDPLTAAAIVPDMVIGLALLENDLGTGDQPFATMAKDIDRFISDWRGRFPNIIVHLCTPRPSFSYRLKKGAPYNFFAITDYIKNLDNGYNIFVSDLSNVYPDPLKRFQPAIGFTDTSVHPNSRGALANARVIADTNKRIQSSARIPYTPLVCNYNFSGSSSSSATNSVGTIPSGGYVISTVSSGICAFVTTAEDPFVTINAVIPSKTTSVIDIGSNQLTSAIASAANFWSVMLKVQIVSGGNNITGLSLEPRITDASGQPFVKHMVRISNDPKPGFKDGEIFTFITPPLPPVTAPMTAIRAYLRFSMDAGDTVSATVRILEQGYFTVS